MWLLFLPEVAKEQREKGTHFVYIRNQTLSRQIRSGPCRLGRTGPSRIPPRMTQRDEDASVHLSMDR